MKEKGEKTKEIKENSKINIYKNGAKNLKMVPEEE